MRLINADELKDQIIDEIIGIIPTADIKDTAPSAISFVNRLNMAPTIDAVPVVRCRECIHRPSVSDHDEIGGFKYEFPDDRCPCKCVDRWYSWMPDDNWFCGNGERREDGDGE